MKLEVADIFDFFDSLMDTENLIKFVAGVVTVGIIGGIACGIFIVTLPIWIIPFGIIQWQKWRKENEN